jgi:protocatechuate 3,4-dioxygenase beta subunit
MPPLVRTDSQGRYTAGPFLTGDAWVRAAHNEPRVTTSSQGGVPWHKIVPIKVGEHLTGVDLVVSRRQEKIAGVVTDPRGKPLEGATVIAAIEEAGAAFKGSSYARNAISRRDGTFEVEDLTRGLHGVWARHPDYADIVQLQVNAGTTNLAFRFGRPTSIAGAVVGKNGRPIPAYTVVVIPSAPEGETEDQRGRRRNNSETLRLGIASPKGVFEVKRLVPGRYDLIVETAEGLLTQASGVAVAEGETKRVRLVAEPGAVVVGRVVSDSDGQPVANARITTVALPAGRIREVRSDDSGAFRLPGVLPGPRARISVYGLPDVHAYERREVALPGAGSTGDVGTVRLKPAGARPVPTP